MVTLDDAASAVYSGLIVAEEGTASSFRARAEGLIDRHGPFCELYTNQGSHYFHTPKALAQRAQIASPAAPTIR